MAKRPTMKELQTSDKMQNTRLDKLEEEVRASKRREIMRYLSERNDPRSSRYRYTYDEIASFMDVSTTQVANIAREEGLARRLTAL